ncbi:hypothetical protein JR316_0012173 [Psilocybe cubensis]|uniref:Uncharacterized protein n=2 Tax=Psilocybe cubensis TaxID=181762 RepID=A0ACB8GH90_PSICU|nr:hypothetical protein JR316_0012173 [Psilocybe cubensis]KAH9475068.1 hypothetical protein JR316_0012173 [Psilocybe cubensis]
MTDLTVLVSPMPLHPVPSGNFTFGRRSFRAQNRPIMVTLETEVDEEADGQKPVVESPTNGDFIDPPTSPPRRPRPPRVVEPDLLAPPVNTWKSRPRHRPTRSQSAPPERRVAPPVDLSASQEEGSQEQKVFYKEALGFKQRNPNRSFTAFNLNRHTNQGGELVRPPPPLPYQSQFIMWVQSVFLFLGSTFPRTLAAGTVNPACSAVSTSTQFPDNVDIHYLEPRQLVTPPVPLPTNPTTTSTSFDFWWPFPAATTTTANTSPQTLITVPIAPVASVIAGSSNLRTEPSLTSDLSFVPSIAALPPTVSTTLSTSSSVSSRPQPASSSSSPTPVSNAVAKPSSKLGYLIPIVCGFSILILGFACWFIYGCCTRRPRVRTDDGELISGPPYIGNNENDARRDIELQSCGSEDPGMLDIPKKGSRRFSSQFRWPSFNEPPAFDPVKGFYVPDEYKDDEEDYYTASLLVPPAAGNVRTKSSRTQRSTAAVKKPSPSAGPSGAASIFSDATSIALLDMYESDGEAEERRRAQEVPWESLRHKSIKRGILEQVQKENKWMDSIRGSISRGSAFLSGRRNSKRREEDEERLVSDTEGHNENERRNLRRSVGKRRGHVRADSDLVIDSAKSKELVDPSENPIPALKPVKMKGLPDDSSNLTRGHRSFVQLKDDPSDIDKYTPLPTRTTENRSRSRSQSRSRSSSPIKRPSATATSRPTSQERRSRPITRDILPNSPSQIMSPPLESQMCFTPIPPLMEVMLSPEPARNMRNKSKSSSSNKSVMSTKTSTPSRKSRKLHARTPPHLPFPGSDSLMNPKPDAYRGRLLKKRMFGPSGTDASSSSKKLPARPPQRQDSDVYRTT